MEGLVFPFILDVGKKRQEGRKEWKKNRSINKITVILAAPVALMRYLLVTWQMMERWSEVLLLKGQLLSLA